MADKSVRGRFVWHDLVTSDVPAAQAFYTKVLGWTTQAWEQDPSYSMFAAASGPLGGTVSDAAEEPHWVVYIGTDNLQSTIDRATGAGASVVKGPTPAGTGEYALLKDPQGVLFGAYSGESSQQKPAAPKRGEFSWFELSTSDPQAALDFYSNLFGWESAGSHDMGEMGKYHMFGRGGQPVGGIYNAHGEKPPSWLGYVRVKDVNQIAKKVKSAGGKVLNGPMEVPGGDWVVQFADPQGATLAAHTLAADLQGAKEAAAASPTTQSVAASEVEELSTPIEPQTTESAPKKSAPSRKPARTSSGKSSSKSSARAKSTKAKAKSKAKKTQTAQKSTKKSAKKSTKKSGSSKAGRKVAKKRGAKRPAAKSVRGARKSAKRSVGRKSAKRKSAKKAAKKKSRSPRRAK